MRKSVAALLLVTVCVSCTTTTGWESGLPSGFKIVYGYDDEPITLEMEGWNLSIDSYTPKSAYLKIDNLSDDELNISWYHPTSWTTSRGVYVPLVPEGSVSSGQIKATLIIPPKSSVVKSFSVRDRGEFIEELLNNSRFVFGYKLGNKQDIAVLDIGTIDIGPMGTVKASKLFFHPLFISMPENQRKVLGNLAMEKAQSQFGPNVTLVNIDYSFYWHLLSIFVGFSLYGWVEYATITATVIGE